MTLGGHLLQGPVELTTCLLDRPLSLLRILCALGLRAIHRLERIVQLTNRLGRSALRPLTRLLRGLLTGLLSLLLPLLLLLLSRRLTQFL